MRLRWLAFAILAVGAGCASFGSSSDSKADPNDAGGLVDATAPDGATIVDANAPESDAGVAAGDACAPPGFCERFTTVPDFLNGPWKMTRHPNASVAPDSNGPANPSGGNTGPSFKFAVSGAGEHAYIYRELSAKESVHCELDLIASTWAGTANLFGATFTSQGGFIRLDAYFGKLDGSIALFYLVQPAGAPQISDAPKPGFNIQNWNHLVYDLTLGAPKPQLSAQVMSLGPITTKTSTPTNGAQIAVEIRVGIFDQPTGPAQDIKVDNVVCVPK